MRAVNFRTGGFDPIMRLLGFEPDADEIPYRLQRSVVEHMNERVRRAWELWDWPELLITEERAFRPVWSSGTAYTAGAEVYSASKTYYRAIADSDAGTLLTNTAKWTPIDVLDHYIDVDQPDKQSIGQVVTVFGGDPRTTAGVTIGFSPSEKGIDVFAVLGTVWVTFKRLPSVFTMKQRVDGKTYLRDDPAYSVVTRECYRSLQEHATIAVTNKAYWQLQQLPYIFADYVVRGAYADTLREWDDGFPAEKLMIRRQMAGEQDANATLALDSEINKLMARGYGHVRYRPWRDSGRRTWSRYAAAGQLDLGTGDVLELMFDESTVMEIA